MPRNQLCILEVVAADIDGMGGVETYLKQLNTELLTNHNAELHVVYPTDNPDSTDPLATVKDRAIHFHPIKMVTHGINKAEVSGNLRRMIAFRRRISDVLETNDIDVVTLHAPYDAPVTVASGVSFRHGIPLVVVHHGGEELFQWTWNPLKLAGKALAYRVIKRADKRAGVSLAAANCLGDDSVVLGSLCDTTRFDPAKGDAKRFKDELGVTKEKIILYPARIVPEKGQMDLLKAGKVLAGRLARRFRIVLIGPTRDEGYLDTLKSYVLENGLEDCVTILPGRAQEDLPDVYAAADVIAFPSLSEGLGLTALEAFAMKKPVVAYRTGGLPEVVRDGTTGALVDRGDVRALAGALAELLVHPERCRELGENGRKLVDNEFNPKVLADRYMALYRGLCSTLRADAK